jgi:hypothetical protein
MSELSESRDALTSLLFDSASLDACVIRKIQENEERMKLNEINQLLVFANNI